jgi:hypothetical protein
MTETEAGDQPAFPPSIVAQVKALACQLPRDSGVPLSKWTAPDLQREVVKRGIVASIGESTIWRWLSEDAIKPWQHRTWIFPRDPLFVEKAGPVLDLYAGHWEGKPLGDGDFVLSTDEKTSIQARRRVHPSLPPAARRAMRVEHEYERCGAWAYLAAWDVHRAKIFGRCELKTGLVPFNRLVWEVMRQEPYKSARRVFWIMDNGSSHRGTASDRRLSSRWPRIVPLHTPIHASWLNQIEIYFSIVQAKVLSPNDYSGLSEVKQALLEFQPYYEGIAQPFEWKFTRDDLKKLMARLSQKSRS